MEVNIPYYPNTHIDDKLVAKWGNFVQMPVKYMMVDNKTLNSFCVTLAINNNESVLESSTFLLGHSFQHCYKQYNTVSQIMYKHMISHESQINNIIDEEVMLFTSEFSGVNFGHDMSITLYCLDKYLKNKMTCKIIMSSKQKVIPRTIEFVTKFIPLENIIFIDYHTMYTFNKCYIPWCHFLNILDPANAYIVNAYIKQIYVEIPKTKCILVKQKDNMNVTNKHHQFIFDDLKAKLIENGWIVINPEKQTLDEFSNLLYNSSHVITSWGCIHYGNQIFFSENTKVLLLFEDVVNDICKKNKNEIHVRTKNINLDEDFNLEKINKIFEQIE